MAEVLPFPVAAAPAELSQPPDAEARRHALHTRSSFIVEAPAGSGKTGLLIQRYLKLLADESVESPEQVLAITFTNKATAELRDRVLAQLEAARLEAAQPANEFDRQTREFARAVLERDRQLGWSLLDHPGRLHLRTIDSVCMEIARTLPVLSGSGGGLTPSDDAGLLHHEAARRTVLLLGTGDAHFDAALGDLLRHRDGNLAECQSLIAEMLSLRDQWGGLIPLAECELSDEYLDSTVLPRLEAALDHAICAALTRLERSFPPDLLADLTELAADLGRNDGYRGDPSPIALCAGLRTSPGAVGRNLEHWRALIHLLLTASDEWRKQRGITSRNLKFDYDRKHPHHASLTYLLDHLSADDDLLAVLCEVRSLPPAEYPAEQWAVAKSLFRVLSRALVELQLVFAEHGQCDFTEFSLRARQALQQDSGADDLAAALGARLQHLLVDEMQDTSTSQYELIERLTASWDGHSQTVLLVGDPRQSIYLFRQARVERFLHALETQRLGDLPLTRLRLTANFRSQKTLVEQFNQDFKLIFPGSTAAPTDPTALPYEHAEPTLPPMPDAAGAVWHTHPLPGSDSSRTDAALACNQLRRDQARRDADQILDIARGWIAMPLPPSRSHPWSIAVLVRGRSHLKEIVAALREQADPILFRAIEIEALGERQEILDLTALTRALLHPADRVAALAVLRAPWCGLSLADLHTLTGADDDTLRNHSIVRLMAERGHLLPDESCQRMGRIWTVLEAAAARRASLTTAQLVERAWLSLGGDTWLSPNQLANAHRFFQLLDELEAPDELLDVSSRIDSSLLQSRLSRLYAEPQPIPANTPFLELLTIHKAKGLEWDVVLVPALEAKVGSNRSRLLTWSEIDSPGPTGSSSVVPDQAAHMMLAPIAGRGEPSKVLNSWLNSIHSAREAAEAKRLFYVACTRARQELHLFAAPRLSAKGELNPASGSLLKAAWAAAQSHFDSLPATQTRAETLHPFQPTAEFEPAALSLAAAASSDDFEPGSSNHSSCPILERLPLTFNPTARFARELAQTLPCGDTASAHSSAHAPFTRPEGSFAARSFGNAVHALLELLSTRIRNGDSPAALLAELASWGPRISALLRADGLPRTTVERLTRDARTSLENTLRDPNGLWLLVPHANSGSEFALTASSEIETQIETRSEDEATPAAQLALPSSIRVDRIFEAGPEPHTPGDGFLWIIDYKTTAPGPTGLVDFLNAQRHTYGPQLETYARILAPARGKSLEQVRLALYFPTIPRLDWWPLTVES